MGISPKRFVFLILIVAFQFCFSQDPILFSNDRYSGISSATLSPTQPFINPNPWDINLLSEDLFLQNDYTYISDQSFFGLMTTNIQSASIKKNRTGENTSSVQDFYNKDLGNYHLSSDIMGPSFFVKIKIKDKDFGIGIFNRLRTQSSALKVDNYLRFGNQKILEPQDYSLQPLQISLMNWQEIGLNLSTEIFPNSDYQWIIGGNFKYEIGLDALNVDSKVPFQITRGTQDINGVMKKSIIASNYDITASFATSYNFDKKKYEYQKKGSGWGLDFGLAFIDKDVDEQDYNTKFSVNVLDFGKVNFDGETHLLNGNALQLENNPTFKNSKFVSPNQYLKVLSKEIYGDENRSFQGNEFSIGLPTSIHLNFSKNIGENQYINSNWIQRLPIFENSLKRSNIFNISYSVQKPVFGYGTSVSLYEYERFQFGGYLRIGPLILGSENFFPLIFRQKKLHSGDFYIAIKLYPFWDNELKRHRRKDCNCD